MGHLYEPPPDGGREPGDDKTPDTDRSPRRGAGNGKARIRSHAHGIRHGRYTVHSVIVLLAFVAVVFAAHSPFGDDTRSQQSLPTFAFSGVAGSVQGTPADSVLRPGTSTRTLSSVAIMSAPSEAATVRQSGGVAPTSSFSSGVSAATGGADGGAGLADVVDPQQPFEVYVTEPGDSVSVIAAQFGISEGTLLDNNPTVTDRNLVTPGLELVVPRDDGVLHRVSFGETLGSIVAQYDNVTEEEVLGYQSNAVRDPDDIEPGVTLLLPGATQKPPPPPEPGPAPAQAADDEEAPAAPPASDGRFQNPLAAYYRVSDPFGTPRGGGRIHTGIDLDLYGYPNSPIYSACDGTVTGTEWWTYSYGYHVIVDCGGGYTTLYAHLSQIDVSVGQPVAAGSHIGVSGLTGFTTGEHLHFEIRRNGTPVDPADYIGF